MAHRGPDDWGVLVAGPGGVRAAREFPSDAEPWAITMLHRRLAIIDLTEAGWQPMHSPDGRQWIVFNGELYNYLDLRRELAGAGHVFRSRSDTEVLLTALRHWGTACLPRLVGMFAFAYLDLNRGEMLLARDPFGIKPLYFSTQHAGVAFASEIDALLELTGQRRLVDPGRLYSFLRFGVTDHGPGTMFAGISQVPAGHFLRVALASGQAAAPERYWVPERLPERSITLSAAAAELRELFCESVRLHLQSDVPIGAALSGGIDSSAIVDVIRHVAGPGTEIKAFSFVPDDEQLSEERWIRMAGERAGAEIEMVRPTSREVAADLAEVIRAQGEPFGSPSIYAQYRVFKAAAERGIKVMLNGQGADELLGGYRPYLGARLAGLIRRRSFAAAGRLFGRARRLPGVGAGHLAMLTADVMLGPGAQRPMRWLTGRSLTPAWMDATWFRARGIAAAGVHYTDDPAAFWVMMERALRETSLPHLLRYDDRNSMVVSLESRVPFLTRPMLEATWSLPEDYLVDDRGTSKRVFRMAMEGLVPQPVLDRLDKVGFVTPVARWMATEHRWVEGIFAFAHDARVPGVDVAGARRIWASRGGDRTRVSTQLWRCLSYIEWVRQFGVEGAAA